MRLGGFHVRRPQNLGFFDPLPPLCPLRAVLFVSKFATFVDPLLWGRHIWKPPSVFRRRRRRLARLSLTAASSGIPSGLCRKRPHCTALLETALFLLFLLRLAILLRGILACLPACKAFQWH